MRNQRNGKRSIEKMKFLLISCAVLVSICLVIGNFIKSYFPNNTQTDTPQNTNNDYYEIHNDDIAKENGNSVITDKAEISTSSWNLLLVNPWNYIPDNFSVELTQLKNGQAIDKRAYPDLQNMMDDMRTEGLCPLICSSYRTNEKQQALYSNEVNQYLAQGYSQTKAEGEAGKWVAIPGTSEHQTGLAVDIVDMSNQNLDETQEDTAVQKWLMENSWKYGFILRYPNNKSDITGINYEPWHYRYVGKEAAKDIYEKGICFEEYLEELNNS